MAGGKVETFSVNNNNNTCERDQAVTCCGLAPLFSTTTTALAVFIGPAEGCHDFCTEMG